MRTWPAATEVSSPGGLNNTAGGFGNSFIGGGSNNEATGNQSFVAGGGSNVASGTNSFAAGRGAKAEHHGTFVWADNTEEDFASTDEDQFLIRASGGVGIGITNPNSTLQVWGTAATGSTSNIASGSFSFVGGGGMNEASGVQSFVGGGDNNEASGLYGFVGGGALNVAAGMRSFAAGFRAKAEHDSTFVWADSTLDDFSSTDEDQFLIRAGGGVGISTDNPNTVLHVRGDGDETNLFRVQDGGASRFTVAGNGGTTIGTFNDNPPERGLYVWGDVGIGTNSPQRDLHIEQSSTDNSEIGLQIENTDGNDWAFYVAVSDNLGFRFNDELMARINASHGAYVQLSDERAKDDIKPVGPVLDHLLRLQPTTYFMAGDSERDQRSIGLIAQDVQEIFPDVVTKQEGQLGISYSEITVLNTAALIELNDTLQWQLDQMDGQLADRDREIDSLTERNDELEERVAELERAVQELIADQTGGVR